MLFWPKYAINILLKDKDASIFRRQIELIKNEPYKDVKARIEKIIKIRFYFKYASPMPHFVEA
jgi:hypothetical protein